MSTCVFLAKIWSRFCRDLSQIDQILPKTFFKFLDVSKIHLILFILSPFYVNLIYNFVISVATCCLGLSSFGVRRQFLVNSRHFTFSSAKNSSNQPIRKVQATVASASKYR